MNRKGEASRQIVRVVKSRRPSEITAVVRRFDKSLVWRRREAKPSPHHPQLSGPFGGAAGESVQGPPPRPPLRSHLQGAQRTDGRRGDAPRKRRPAPAFIYQVAQMVTPVCQCGPTPPSWRLPQSSTDGERRWASAGRGLLSAAPAWRVGGSPVCGTGAFRHWPATWAEV